MMSWRQSGMGRQFFSRVGGESVLAIRQQMDGGGGLDAGDGAQQGYLRLQGLLKKWLNWGFG